MESIYVFHLNIEKAGEVNGVSRCIQSICTNISSKAIIQHRLTFTNVDDIREVKHDGYLQTFIPLPKDMKNYWVNIEWRRGYWLEIIRLLKPLFQHKLKLVLHIHTLNLIEIALLLCDLVHCKIITHIHCWPWKLLYNSNKKLFCQLYEKYYYVGDYKTSNYVLKDYEASCYAKSDSIICVTDCMRQFIERMYPNNSTQMNVIPNGLGDSGYHHAKPLSSSTLSCIFVGSYHPAKGLMHILGALNIIKMKCPVKLMIVGNYPLSVQMQITQRYKYLDIEFTGLLPIDLLDGYYEHSDVGIIASFHEQCSYTAIEMMRKGLPIITTNADGLNEMFKNEENAIVIPLEYSNDKQLIIDINKIAEALLRLKNDKRLRKTIGRRARQSYEKHYNIKQMLDSITNVYESLFLRSDI